MSDFRAQIVARLNSTDPGRDYQTNVLYYSAPTTPVTLIGDALKTAFTGSTRPYNGLYSVQVKMYDLANPLHSPPVYTSTYSGAGLSTPGPRQLALCLSFFSGLNIRGQRGRIYIGAWPASAMTEYASTAILTNIITLAGDLRHPGGSDVIHMIRHPKTSSFSNVSNYFVNNRWDTMRSRLPRETARQTLP